MTDSSASAMDWNDLASRQLPRLSTAANNDGTTASTIQYNRNLSQLHVAGQSLLQGGRPYGQQQPPPQGFATTMTTTQWHIAPAAAADTQLQPPLPIQQQQQHRVFESLEDAMHRQEQEIFESIVSRTQDEIRASTDARIEAQLQKAWDAERAVWAKELVGTRWLGGAASTEASSMMTTAGPLIGHHASSHQPSLLVTPPHIEDRTFHQTIETAQLLDPSLVQAHLEIVKQMSNDTRSLQDTIEQFSLLLTDRPAENRAASTLGYASAWQLTQKLVEAVAINHHDASSSASPVQQAKGALSHFCRQFQIYVNSTVRHAALAGQDTSSSYQNDLTAQCEAFAKIKLGMMMMNNDNDDPAWAVVYYCLRCGDAVAASQVLLPVTDPAVERCLTAMAQAQGGSAGVWDSTRTLPLRLDPADRRTVADLLESAKRAETPNLHQIGTYALLSGSNTSEPVTSETVEGFKTIEDYLTGALWTAVLQQNPVDEVIRLGELIQNFGPTYFQDPASGGWSFALPLLATQQYQKALTWLTEAGGKMGLLQATHIGLVLSNAGIALRNLGVNDSFAVDGTVASLLVAYATELLFIPTAGSLAALEYLVCIPNEVRARKEVAKLIANTGEVNKLVGDLNSEGVREGGAIADRYSGPELASILVAAADILSAFKGDQHKLYCAFMCLMLAERYGDALSFLNEMLSPPNKPDKDRNFWLEHVNEFHTKYLSKRTHVLEVLERQGKTALIRTSHMLVDLNAFFDRLTHGGSEGECWNIAEKLQLLPTSASNRAIKESGYKGIDPLIKESYPAFLVGAMNILYREYRRLKRELYGDTTGVVRERLKELQEKAHLYTGFAASVGMADEQTVKLTELASLII